MEASKIIFIVVLGMSYLCIKAQNGVIGGDCRKDGDCKRVGNSACILKPGERGKCGCKPDFILSADNTTCVERRGVGDSCSTIADCGGDANIVCADSVCTCSNTSVPTDTGKRCVSRAGYNEVCLLDIQCNFSDKAECLQGRCKCASDLQFNGTTCIGTIKLGDQCVNDIQCNVPQDQGQTTVWCYNKQCSCRFGYTREDDRCVIGGDCTKDEDCVELRNSFCNVLPRDRAKCACKADFIAAVNNTKCLSPASMLGDSCQDKAQCTAKLGMADCRNEMCICEDGVRENKDRTKCGAGHNEVCLLDTQCVFSDNAKCIHGRCKCASDFQFNGTTCVRTTKLGDQCEYDIQCNIPQDAGQKTVWCYNKQCACRPGFTRQDDKCVIGGDCIEDQQCEHLENSFCNALSRDRAKCACKGDFVAAVNNTKCLPPTSMLGAGCQDKAQCTAKLGMADCRNQRCICEDGIRENKDKTKCGAPVSTVTSISCFALLILVKLL